MKASPTSYLDFLRNSELSKVGCRRFADSVERSQLERIDLSTSVVIQNTQRSATNSLALEKNEYRYLLSGSVNGVVSLYDLEPSNISSTVQNIAPLLAHSSRSTASIATIQWYPEDTGAFVCARMDGDVSIYDTNVFAPVASFSFPDNVAYSARMRCSAGSGHASASPLIAVALQDGSVRLCDPRTRDSSQVLRGHSRAVTRVEWSPAAGEAHLLVSAGMDGAVRMWDVRRAGGLAEAALWSLDCRGDFRSAAKIDTARLYTPLSAAQSIHNRSTTGAGSRTDPIVIGEGRKVYQAAVFSPFEGRSTAENQLAARAHDAAVLSLQYTSCGNYLLTAGSDRRLRLWHAGTGALLPVHFPEKVLPSAQLPYDMGLAEFSYARDDVVITPAGAGGAVACKCNVSALSNASSAGAEGQSSSQLPLIATREGDLLLTPVHTSDGQPMRILRGHLERVTAVVYRRTHQQIISAARDGMIFLWTAPQERSSSARGGGREKSRHAAAYYGTSGGRYDYEQVASRVLNTVESAGSAAADSEAASSSSVRRALRVLPVTERDAPSASLPAAAAPAARNARQIESDGSSGDDWSDDEPESQLTGDSGIRRIGSVSAGVSGATQRGRKAARIVAEATMTAGDHTAGYAPHTSATASASSNRTAGAATTSAEAASARPGGRSFVPPIIQQYLREAEQGAALPSPAPAMSVGSSSSSAAAPRRWDQVGELFDLPPAAAPTAEGVAGNAVVVAAPTSSGSGSSGARAAGGGGAGGAAALTADQRYAQWVKQQQLRARSKKK
jgi:DNA excision repair protein ERCC-8